MKNPIRIAIILLLIIATLTVLLFYTLPCHFSAEGATRLTVFEGSTGKQIEITDPSAIETITQSITAPTFRRGNNARIDGFRYTLTWYDADGEILLSLSLTGDSKTLIHDGRFYHAKNNALLDLTPLDALFDCTYKAKPFRGLSFFVKIHPACRAFSKTPHKAHFAVT